MEEQLPNRQWTNLMVQPGSLTLSPHIVRRAHVLSVNAASRVYFQAGVPRIDCQNRVFGSQPSGFGICRRKLFDLNR